MADIFFCDKLYFGENSSMIMVEKLLLNEFGDNLSIQHSEHPIRGLALIISGYDEFYLHYLAFITVAGLGEISLRIQSIFLTDDNEMSESIVEKAQEKYPEHFKEE